jgi:hypothetical protein
MDNDFLAGDAAQSCAYEGNIQQSNMSKTGKIITPIGTKADGELFFLDISPIPHFLVCGFSGTGKTSFVRTVMTYIATHYSPEEARFLIYDSRNVDYNDFNALPHLATPVITGDRKVAGSISWLSLERKKRLKVLADSSAKDIVTYNKQCAVSGNEKLPHLFVILDDFSSVKLDNDTTVSLMDVLKNGRPVGIHFILVTSLTSSKVLQRDILSNVPCRISFCVSTRADSRVAIEQNGAENLCVPGELIFRWQNNLVKCQGVYLPDEDIQRAIKKLQRQNKKSVNALGNMAAQIFENPSSNQSTQTPATASECDELFPAAVDVVFETGQASASMIQHRLKLGYTRAVRLIDMMEECGIVGPYEGSKPRQILVTKAQWQAKNGTSNYFDSIVAETRNSSVSTANTTSNTNSDDDELPDIIMRNFAQFNFSDIGLCITDNQIKISNRVMTKYGPGTTTASFNGKSVAGLTYKKPRIFSCGYIEFIMKPNVKIINNSSHLITITKDNLSDILKIEFDNNVSHTMKTFMTQISQDIGVPLNEL